MGCRPPPVPGATLELGFLGTVLRVELPQDLDEQQLGNGPHIQPQTDQDWHVSSANSFPSEHLCHNCGAASRLFTSACHAEYDSHIRGFIVTSLVYMGVPRIV